MRDSHLSPNVGLAIIAGTEFILLLTVCSVILPKFASLYRDLGVQDVWWYSLALFLKRYSGLIWLATGAFLILLLLWASRNDTDAMRRGLMLLCLVFGLCIPLTFVLLFKPLGSIVTNLSAEP